MFEFPERMDSNNFCNHCAECLKTCSRNNLALRGPWPYLILMLLIALADAYLLNLPMEARHIG